MLAVPIGHGERIVACDECGDLHTHEFRSSSDLLHALQVAALEVDRGVLERLRADDLTLSEEGALSSALAASGLPDTVHYRFRCTVCGDLFELLADTVHGSGSWKREGEAAS
jgi:hypothetical protein